MTVALLVKKPLPLYWARRFITMSATARHWFLTRSRCIQSTLSHRFFRCILILFSNPYVSLQVFRQIFCRNLSHFTCVLHAPRFSMSLVLISHYYLVQSTNYEAHYVVSFSVFLTPPPPPRFKYSLQYHVLKHLQCEWPSSTPIQRESKNLTSSF
jgi:hypothetical protein